MYSMILIYTEYNLDMIQKLISDIGFEIHNMHTGIA